MSLKFIYYVNRLHVQLPYIIPTWPFLQYKNRLKYTSIYVYKAYKPAMQEYILFKRTKLIAHSLIMRHFKGKTSISLPESLSASSTRQS